MTMTNVQVHKFVSGKREEQNEYEIFKKKFLCTDNKSWKYSKQTRQGEIESSYVKKVISLILS